MWRLCTIVRLATLPLLAALLLHATAVVGNPLHSDSYRDVQKRPYKNFLRFGRGGSAEQYDILDDDDAAAAAALDLAMLADVYAAKRAAANKNFLRFGRGFSGANRNFLRFGRAGTPRSMNFLRFGRAANKLNNNLYPIYNNNNNNQQQHSKQKSLEAASGTGPSTEINNQIQHDVQNGGRTKRSAGEEGEISKEKDATIEFLDSDSNSGSSSFNSRSSNPNSSISGWLKTGNENGQATESSDGSNFRTSNLRSKRAVPNLFALLNAPNSGMSTYGGDWFDDEEDDMLGFHYGGDSSEEGNRIGGVFSSAALRDIQKRAFPRSFLRYGRQPSDLHFIRFGKRGDSSEEDSSSSSSSSSGQDSSEEGHQLFSLGGVLRGSGTEGFNTYDRMLRARNNKNFLRFGR